MEFLLFRQPRFHAFVERHVDDAAPLVNRRLPQDAEHFFHLTLLQRRSDAAAKKGSVSDDQCEAETES